MYREIRYVIIEMLWYLLFEEVHVCHKDMDVAVSELCQTAERVFGKNEKEPTVMENIASCVSDIAHCDETELFNSMVESSRS